MRMQIHAMHADGAVTLWWEKPEQASGKETFTVTYGDTQLQTEKTHCTFKDLPEETVCRFSVFMGDVLLGETTVKTGKRLRKISVTDFGVVGDGKTMNTQALQQAIDEGSPYRIRQENCLHCGLCFRDCPAEAIIRRAGEAAADEA